MCGGSSSQQTEEANEQQAYSQQLMQENQTQFGEQQGILGSLTKAYEPILAAGPSQEGFSDAQKTAMNTQAMDSSADAYQNAAKALNSNYAAKGGGETEYIPSGAEEQMDAQTAQAGAKQLAGAQNQITQEDYAQGLQNFNTAAGVLGGASGQEGTTGATAGAATGASTDASNTANQVNQANNAWEGVLGGALGGVAGKMSYTNGGFTI